MEQLPQVHKNGPKNGAAGTPSRRLEDATPHIWPRSPMPKGQQPPKEAKCASQEELEDAAKAHTLYPGRSRAITCARRRKPRARSRRSQRVGRAGARTQDVVQPINQHTTATGLERRANQALGGLRARRGRRASTCNEAQEGTAISHVCAGSRAIYRVAKGGAGLLLLRAGRMSDDS